MSERKPTIKDLETNFSYDLQRYAKHSFRLQSSTREHQSAILRILTHYIEGGMAFPDVRLGYGQEKIDSIFKKLDTYLNDFEADDTVEWVLATLKNYVSFHENRDFPLENIKSRLRRFLATI